MEKKHSNTNTHIYILSTAKILVKRIQNTYEWKQPKQNSLSLSLLAHNQCWAHPQKRYCFGLLVCVHRINIWKFWCVWSCFEFDVNDVHMVREEYSFIILFSLWFRVWTRALVFFSSSVSCITLHMCCIWENKGAN